MSVLAPLAPLRAHAGQRLTTGLDDASIERLAAHHPDLGAAIAAAGAEYARVHEAAADLLELLDEDISGRPAGARTTGPVDDLDLLARDTVARAVT